MIFDYAWVALGSMGRHMPQNFLQYLCPSTASKQTGWAVSFMRAQSRAVIISPHRLGWRVGQFCSSDTSPQSLSESHLQLASIQRPLAHFQSVVGSQTQLSSSEASAQSSSPSHFHLASIHFDPSAHLNWLAAQAPVQFLSSQLSLQSSSPSHTQAASIHR